MAVSAMVEKGPSTEDVHKIMAFLGPTPCSLMSTFAQPLPLVDVHFIWSYYSLSWDTSIYCQYSQYVLKIDLFFTEAFSPLMY